MSSFDSDGAAAGAGPSRVRKAIVALSIVATGFAFMAEMPASQDTPEGRRVAAEEFIKAVPPSEEIGRLIQEMSHELPENQRQAFIEEMEQRVNMAYMKGVMLDGLVTELTTAELSAAAKFYASPEGKSVREKLPKVIDGITPLIQGELERTARKLLR
jgi:hypothetical protein